MMQAGMQAAQAGAPPRSAGRHAPRRRRPRRGRVLRRRRAAVRLPARSRGRRPGRPRGVSFDPVRLGCQLPARGPPRSSTGGGRDRRAAVPPAGHGHSDGNGSDLTLDSLVDDARAVADLLRERCPVETVMLLGTRFGALAASALAAELDDAPVVLWEPTSDPRRFLREGLRARAVHLVRRPGLEREIPRSSSNVRFRRPARRSRRARCSRLPPAAISGARWAIDQSSAAGADGSTR